MSNNDLHNSELLGTLFPEQSPPNAEASPLTQRLAAWVDLVERKRQLEAQLRTVQDELTATEGPLLEDFALSGMQSVNINGMLVYRAREFFCRAKEGIDKDKLVDGLRSIGMGHAVGLQWQTMRAMAREWSEAGEEMPAALSDLVDMGENFRLRTRKSS